MYFVYFKMTRHNTGALRITASVFGTYAGVLGLEHGYFETLQGNVVPAGTRIRASLAELPFPFGHEPAMTIVPNFLVTGILAMIVGLLIIVWAVVFVHQKNGARVLSLLSVILILVGGGFGPITLLITASVASGWIGKPLTRWRLRLSSNLTRILAKAWPSCLIAALLWAPSEFIAGYIFSIKNDPHPTLTNLNLILSYPMLALFALTLIAGFASELQRQMDLHPKPSMSGMSPPLT